MAEDITKPRAISWHGTPANAVLDQLDATAAGLSMEEVAERFI